MSEVFTVKFRRKKDNSIRMESEPGEKMTEREAETCARGLVKLANQLFHQLHPNEREEEEQGEAS
jgi:hypothetical protein